MGTRVVGITSICDLSVKDRQLIIRADVNQINSVPIEDIAVLMLDHQGVRVSHAVLQQCLENNVTVLLCDSKHLPQSILQPLCGNTLQAKIQREQLESSVPRRKQIWQILVRTKILQQSKVLTLAGKAEPDLTALAHRVKSGDAGNLEAQAARLYWRRLFGGEFRRDPDGAGINAFLNYGYAVIRAALARAVISAGLNPLFSVHHQNQYNPFALIDDLIEPMRPRVDLHVLRLGQRFGDGVLKPESKRVLLELLTQECLIEGQSFPILIGLERYSVSVRAALTGKGDVNLDIPLL